MAQTRDVSADRDAALRETPVDRQPVYSGRLIRVFDDTVRLPDGRSTHREVVQHPGAVAIVAIDDRERVVLVRQWRHPAGRALWEIPAGTRDQDGEAIEATARRELAEEAGVTAGRWRSLGHAPLAPGYSTEEMHFFAAADLQVGTPDAAPDELLEVGWFDRNDVARLIRTGEVDVKTMSALALAGWVLDGDG